MSPEAGPSGNAGRQRVRKTHHPCSRSFTTSVGSAICYSLYGITTRQQLVPLPERGPEEIRLLPPHINPVYARSVNGGYTNIVESFDGRQSVHVESANVSGIEALANSVAELVTEGVVVDSGMPGYLFTKLDDMKVEMLSLATENAKQRASAMAKSTGNGIGPMRSSQMGVFQITPANSTDVSDYGINDTSTIEKKVTAVVNITFTLAGIGTFSNIFGMFGNPDSARAR